MANATARGINLILNAQEATALLYLLNNVGGSPKSSGRRYVDDIAGAIVGAGVQAPSSNSGRLHTGSFSFNDNTLSAFITGE